MTVYDYIGLYFFSAVFQGNMALLALLGVFVVFKQQMVTTELREKGNDFITSIREFLNLKISIMVSATQPPHYLLAFSY